MGNLAPKKAMSLTEKLAVIDKVSAGINEKAGKKVIGRIGADPEIMEKLTIKFVPTPSQNLNSAWGGGFPKGRSAIVAGLPDSGKTSIVLEAIAYNMKKDPNFVAGWLESESSLEKDFICKTFGIDPNRFLFLEHERQGAGEQALNRVEAMLATGAFDIFCINSLKCLVPSEEFEKGMESMQIGAQARMNSKMQRKFTALVSEYETAFVIITHLTTQIGTMSKDPLIVSGGNAIIFGASLILDFRKKAIQESDPVTREEAIKIGVSVKKNHCTPSKNPYLKTDYFAIFGEGIERYLETLDNAIEQGILVKSGSFIKDPDAEGNPKILPDGTKLQWQGNAKFREFCKQNPEWFESLIARTTGNAVQMSIDEIDEAKREEEEIKGSLGDDVIAEIEQGAEEGKKKKVNKRK